MKTLRIMVMTVAALFAVAACSEDALDDVASEVEDATDVTIGEGAEQDAIELAAEVEAEMTTLASEIQSSAVAADLQDAFTDLQGELTAAIASMDTDGRLTSDDLQEELSEFQGLIDDAGDEITPELRSAWDSIRAKIESMLG